MALKHLMLLIFRRRALKAGPVESGEAEASKSAHVPLRRFFYKMDPNHTKVHYATMQDPVQILLQHPVYIHTQWLLSGKQDHSEQKNYPAVMINKYMPL
ncbi:MAG TPA: hypothetical protein VL947_06005 [Cytophagales bacterium]|nr:hypothetical protein [Cytophagales bacterium]